MICCFPSCPLRHDEECELFRCRIQQRHRFRIRPAQRARIDDPRFSNPQIRSRVCVSLKQIIVLLRTHQPLFQSVVIPMNHRDPPAIERQIRKRPAAYQSQHLAIPLQPRPIVIAVAPHERAWQPGQLIQNRRRSHIAAVQKLRRPVLLQQADSGRGRVRMPVSVTQNTDDHAD